MKLLINFIRLIAQTGNLKPIEIAQSENNLNTIINILSIGFAAILILLIINLIKVYKQKRKIQSLEERLNTSL